MTIKVGVLKIETEAIAEILARTDKNIISRINLNYVQPSYKREIEIIGTAGSVFWDYNIGNVEFFDKSSNESKIIHSCDKSFDRNDMFLEYMKFFIKNIDNLETVSSLSNGEKSLKLALAIHDSAKSKSLVIL